MAIRWIDLLAGGAMPNLVGKTLTNRYHLLAKLGEGSMASVYRAGDRVRGCLVAVKVLKAHHLDDPATFKRFRREAESLARLEHPHIVRFYELVTKAEAPFLVMDYIEGQSVAQLLEERQGEPLPLSEATHILYQIGGALHFAHQQGILHRDIKPSNVLLDRSGDFICVMGANGSNPVNLTQHPSEDVDPVWTR